MNIRTKTLLGLVVLSLSMGSQAAEIASEGLPLEVRIDLLREQLADHIRNENHQGIVDLVPQFRALELTIPDSLYFLEGRALYRLGRALEARDRLVYYLRNTGREGTYYEEATELLLAVREQAEIQAREREEQERLRREEMARRAEKARMLRIREAQRNLYQVGFRLEDENGELTIPTREALAVYQIRRGLEVNGDVTDETLEALEAEVPESHTCDELAAYHRKPRDIGIPIDQIAAQVAIPTCNDALRSHPEVVRFQVQYARALIAANRIQDARNEIADAVDKGYPEAEMLVGLMYQRGNMDDRGREDHVEALNWFRMAAEKNYPPAQVAIGNLYYNGLADLRRDYESSVDWYSKAAEQGYPPAQTALARAYIDSRGVDRDYATALEWLTLAAESGYADAEYLIGNLYERGRGVKRDRDTALSWYRRASDRGHGEATERVMRLGG